MYIDPTLYTARPAEKRSAEEEAVYDKLEELGISFARKDHDRADTIESCHAIETGLGCGICKNLLLTPRNKSRVYLLMLPGDKPFKTKYLSQQIGSARLSFADEEQMVQLLHLTPGSVSVLGLLFDTEDKVTLLIDEDLLREEYVGCHPCRNTSTLRLRLKDVLERFLPSVRHAYTTVTLPWEPE